MIEIDVVKMHLRLEVDEVVEDPYLKLLIESAIDAFSTFTNRKLIAENAELPQPIGNVLRITPSIRHGALLLIGHWYSNRESSVIGVAVSELPMSTCRLWLPHRWKKF